MLRSMNGKSPRIAATAFVSELAYVVGDVEVGEYASVWPGAIVRSDDVPIRIGSSANVQDGSVVHASGDPLTIGEGVTIGHGVVVHASYIGKDSLLGNNCTVLEHARVGEGCLIGANAVVLAGSDVPDGSFVTGVPGRVKGPVTASQLAMMRENARGVFEEAQRYRDAGL